LILKQCPATVVALTIQECRRSGGRQEKIITNGTRTTQGRAQLYARVFSWIPKFSGKKTYTYNVCIYVYVLKKERNKSKWIVCEKFSPKTLLLPLSVLTRWPNSSIRPNTACISLSPHQMAQQLNTTQYSLHIPQSPPDGPTA
jgi:hypothetical protein